MSLEGDLGTPSAGSLIFVDPANPAAVVAGNGTGTDGAANSFDTCSIDKMYVVVGGILAAAADRVADLEIGLADRHFIAAGTAAFPEMLAGALPVVGDNGETAKLFADPVLERLPAEAPAASAITGIQLAGRSDKGISAVTDTVP